MAIQARQVSGHLIEDEKGGEFLLYVARFGAADYSSLLQRLNPAPPELLRQSD
ncbi:MAG: hypothetical protein AAGH38_00695 [Pseudomonadota bacterium]